MAYADDERTVTAHHEAGHVVAAIMRGKTLNHVTIDRTHEHLGFTGYRGTPMDAGFISYAGIWSEAKFFFENDQERDADSMFQDYEVAAWMTQHDDRASVEKALETFGLGGVLPPEAIEQIIAAAPDWLPKPEQTLDVWRHELDALWPAIEAVAADLLAGRDVTTETVEAHLGSGEADNDNAPAPDRYGGAARG